MAVVAHLFPPLHPPFVNRDDRESSPALDYVHAQQGKLAIDLGMPPTSGLFGDKHDPPMSSSEPNRALCSPSDDDAHIPSPDDFADRRCEEFSAPLTFERKLGDTELSYFLPSRADGVNDMCVPFHPRLSFAVLIKAHFALLRAKGTSTLASAPPRIFSPTAASAQRGRTSGS